MKTNAILLRLDDEDFKIVSKEAKEAGVSRAELVRTFLHQGLSGYDRKHEDIVQRVKGLEDHVSQVHELVAVVAAQVSALDLPRKSNDRIPEMTDHLKQGFQLADGIQIGQKRGLFKKGEK